MTASANFISSTESSGSLRHCSSVWRKKVRASPTSTTKPAQRLEESTVAMPAARRATCPGAGKFRLLPGCKSGLERKRQYEKRGGNYRCSPDAAWPTRRYAEKLASGRSAGLHAQRPRRGQQA